MRVRIPPRRTIAQGRANLNYAIIRLIWPLCGLLWSLWAGRPVAGVGVGTPATPAFVSARLPLGLTVHRDRYTDATDEKVRAYDKRRNGIFPYRTQRNVARFGEAKEYGWSEEKARHYAVPEREDFGAYVKRRGFRLE